MLRFTKQFRSPLAEAWSSGLPVFLGGGGSSSPVYESSVDKACSNNGRFLILPWVHVKGLGSAILARSARQIPQDWRQRYGYTPLLLETLVDAERFRGTCYRAANWIYLGYTVGGIRTDRLQRARPGAVKRIFVFPLHRHAQQLLCAADSPTVLCNLNQ